MAAIDTMNNQGCLVSKPPSDAPLMDYEDLVTEADDETEFETESGFRPISGVTYHFPQNQEVPNKEKTEFVAKEVDLKPKFRPFTGTAYRLDGTPAAYYSPSEDSVEKLSEKFEKVGFGYGDKVGTEKKKNGEKGFQAFTGKCYRLGSELKPSVYNGRKRELLIDFSDERDTEHKRRRIMEKGSINRLQL